jgi:hypothetical protein
MHSTTDGRPTNQDPPIIENALGKSLSFQPDGLYRGEMGMNLLKTLFPHVCSFDGLFVKQVALDRFYIAESTKI